MTGATAIARSGFEGVRTMKGKLTSLQKHIIHSTSPRAVKGANTPHTRFRDHGPTLAEARAIRFMSGTRAVPRG